FGRGLILGVGAALLYAAARETIAPARRRASDTAPDENKTASDEQSRLIDWNLATQVAIRAAGRTPALHPGARTQLQAQYEAKLYFVEPNLQQVEDTLGVPPEELRRWIALHEATNAHEFELYPWVREYLNNSLKQYLKLLIEDMRGRNDENTMLTIVNRFVG